MTSTLYLSAWVTRRQVGTDVARFLGALCMNSLYSRHSSLGERFRVSTGATGRSVFNCRYIPLVVGISIKREILDRTSVDGRSEVKDKLLKALTFSCIDASPERYFLGQSLDGHP